MAAKYYRSMHSDSCVHQRDTHPHTKATGAVVTVTYCVRCGMEWTKESK